MATRPVNLPPGFVLEQQQSSAPNLPPGFVLDAPAPQQNSAPQEQVSSDTGVWSGLKRAATNIFNMPGDAVIAASKPPQNASEDSLYNAVSGLPVLGPGAANALLAGKRMFVDPLQQEAETSRRMNKIADQNGNEDARHLANMHAIASGVPVLGPVAANLTQRYLLGDKSGALAEGAAYVAAPKIADEALNVNLKPAGSLIGKAVEPLKPSNLKPANLFPGKQAVVYPEAASLPPEAVKAAEGIFQAAAPTGLNRNFRANLYAATPDLAEIGRNIKLDEAKGGLINPDMRVKATVDAIDSHLADMYKTERAPQIERNAYRPIHNASFGPDAIEGLKYIERTAGTDALRGLAKKALDEGVLPLAEADQLAMAVNKNLRSFERMTPAEQAAAGITNRRMGSLDALDSAFGKSINQALKRAGEPGIQGYERRYAALSEISSQLGKRVNAVELNQPGIIKGVLKPIAGALRGGPSGIASASQAAVADVNIGSLLQKSFEDLAATGLSPNRATRP